MKTTALRIVLVVVITTLAIVILPASILIQQQAFAKMVYNYILKTYIDTDKPLVQQFNKDWSNFKGNLSATQWKNFTNTWSAQIENGTDRCIGMSTIFKAYSFGCNTNIALVLTMCKANVLKQDVLFCSDSQMSDYLKSKNVTNIEGYAKYALEQQPTSPSAERLSQQQQQLHRK